MSKKIGNSTDKKKLEEQGRKEKLIREKELDDIKEVLKTSAGRRFIWRLLSKCKAFNSVWHSSALIHYNSGQQDIGHFIMAEITDADVELLFKMMKEHKKEKE